MKSRAERVLEVFLGLCLMAWAVTLAALSVFGTGSGLADVIVAGVMSGSALRGAVQVIQQATGELRTSRQVAVTA